jgi:tRNA (cytidine32/uridine32-2'-O)-methyltransferase
MLELPIHRAVRFLLVNPHYPENLGACCRAMKTMGFTQIGIVRPSRLATPDHPMAQKMAVKSWDLLDNAEIYDNVSEAIVGADFVVGSTARRGVTVISPKDLATRATKLAGERKKVAVLFGNEKSGLTAAELTLCDAVVRAPIAAEQPSLNLAQALQIITYELFSAALEEREAR